ncbi:hypothetical protein PSHT_09015 [Puccinia striiformis]|uniref:Uncharacterized protein n=1 Tax=Puccinia striiformis TaxID=27350 RepID=A0A2S4VJI2_9BASI|nr:hypothetical protein PSHT_09015 [Puccinia striiformis]
MPSSSSSSASSFSPRNHNMNSILIMAVPLTPIIRMPSRRKSTSDKPPSPSILHHTSMIFPDRASTRTKRSKPSFSIVRRTGRTSRLKGVPKSRRRNTTLTVPPSRDEDLEYDDDDDDDDDEEDLEDAEWVRERWNQLMDRQRTAEADVRRTILNRDRLAPSELSRWLDSDETCTLPLPTLGVQLRMMKSD